MRRGVEQTAIRLKGCLRAITVVDIEIDDSHSGEAVRFARSQRTDSGIVEQAEAHSPLRLGMMARWTNGAKHIIGLSRHHRIDRRRDGAGGTQRRFSRCRRQHGIGIDPDMTGLGHSAENAVDMLPWVDSQQIFAWRLRRFAALQPSEFRIVKRR
jgi:hypothetical protein